MIGELVSQIKKVDDLLAEDYLLLADFGLAIDGEWERHFIPLLVLSVSYNNQPAVSGKQIDASALAAACQSFSLFRRLHYQTDGDTASLILMADFCYGHFLRLLDKSQALHLLTSFSQFLAEDSRKAILGEKNLFMKDFAYFIVNNCSNFAELASHKRPQILSDVDQAFRDHRLIMFPYGGLISEA